MGASNSRMESRPSRRRLNRSSLSSLLCGASSSRASYQMERESENSHEVYNHRVESSVSVSASRSGISGLATVIGASTDSCVEGGLRSTGTSSPSRYVSECDELICPRQVSGVLRRDESSRASNHRASESRTLFRDQQSSNTDSVNDDLVYNGADPVSDPRSADQILTPSATLQPSSGLGFLLSNRERALSDDSVLHLDVLSVSSNALPNSSPERSSNLEARRSSRRMFWDAFSRRSSRRLLDSPTIVFSMDENEEVGSRDGWVFGLSGDFFDDGNGSDSGYLGRRVPFSAERRRHPRSEVWERLRSGRDENVRRNAFCPSGLHPDGACSCESLLRNEESSTRASVSRIVMLAEALFEVLDEIHRQPVSLSVSRVSSPAPESVVDSLPLKSHIKLNNGKNNDEAAECYICLAEYDEGDKIRVLPCRHEYHMGCVDKWLKEIHGVCPLCRVDIREGLTDATK